MRYAFHPQIVAAFVGIAAIALGSALSRDVEARERHSGIAALLVMFGLVLAGLAILGLGETVHAHAHA